MSSTEARSILAAINDEELQEEDVWGVSKEQRIMFNSKTPSLHFSSSFSHKQSPSASRMIPRSTNTNIFNQEQKIVQQSAPVLIPDWSKIYGSPKTSSGSKNDSWGQHGGGGWENNDDEEDEDGGGSMVPPHEWIDRRIARRQITSFSMCEGVGRTLKGKDLSRVRNDVLTKTGFLE
ncbi:hypothetical protein Leryth_023992 [Lithospermum erythrorhizon]|nr:hypothetical protein Leryth_023992 [Lithospermum erythrorhizon]